MSSSVFVIGTIIIIIIIILIEGTIVIGWCAILATWLASLLS